MTGTRAIYAKKVEEFRVSINKIQKKNKSNPCRRYTIAIGAQSMINDFWVCCSLVIGPVYNLVLMRATKRCVCVYWGMEIVDRGGLACFWFYLWTWATEQKIKTLLCCYGQSAAQLGARAIYFDFVQLHSIGTWTNVYEDN